MAHILVVDDDELERTFAGRVMAAGNHTVAFATNGESALELYQNGGIDLVVTDLAMPRLNGLRLIQRLVEYDENVRIIAVSGLNRDQLLIAEDYGANELLPKPWGAREMLDAITRVLGTLPQRSSGWGRNRQKAASGFDDVWY